MITVKEQVVEHHRRIVDLEAAVENLLNLVVEMNEKDQRGIRGREQRRRLDINLG